MSDRAHEALDLLARWAGKLEDGVSVTSDVLLVLDLRYAIAILRAELAKEE